MRNQYLAVQIGQSVCAIAAITFFVLALYLALS